MRLGIITPINYLNLSNSDLSLCYTTLLSELDYRQHFERRRQGTLLLDYSPRLPRKTDIVEHHEVAMKVKPTAVIVPGADYSVKDTIRQFEMFENLGGYPDVVGCVQGHDLESLRTCYEFLRDCCGTIGLASPLETIARRDEIIRDLGIKEPVLYVEVYYDPYEEIPPPNAVGICTSYPVRLAADWRRLSDFRPTPPPLDFHSDSIVEELAKQNIEEYKEALRYGG